MIRGRWAWSAMILTTTGCVGSRPATPTAAAIVAPLDWRSAPSGRVTIGANWWRTLNDPVLDGYVSAALANNVDLAIAASRIDEARAQERLARAQLLPNLDAGASVAHQRSVSAFGQAQVQTVGGPLVSASYDLDLFGRLANGDAAARAALLATSYGRDVVTLAVASSTVSSYIILRALDARLAIARSTLADRAAALKYARRRAEVGYTSRLEWRQAEAEYRATEQLVPQIELAITRQENALRVLIGTVPAEVPRGLPLSDFPVPAVPDGLPADLLRRRPDLAQAEQQLVASDRSLDSARAAFLPDIRLSGSAGAALSTLLTSPVAIWSIGGSILAPLFEGGRLTAQSDAAAARRDQAAFGYRRAALTAFREVEDGLAATQRTAEQLEALRQQRTALAQALRLATNRYNAGYAPYIDQLDAQRGLLTADLSVVQAESDQLTALVQLYQAMGGGWATPPA